MSTETKVYAFAFALTFICGVLAGYLWYSAELKKIRKRTRAYPLDRELPKWEYGYLSSFCYTLEKRMRSVLLQVKGRDLPYVGAAVDHLRTTRESSFDTSLAELIKAAHACRIYIFWVEEKYMHVVRKALEDAGALSLLILTTIAHFAMVVCFIAITFIPVLALKAVPPMRQASKATMTAMRTMLASLF